MKNYSIILIILVLFSCKKETKTNIENRKLKIVATTSQITDLIKELAGDVVDLEGLMGAGVDPHLYKASEGDVTKFYNADIIFYSGLHLEGKLEDVFEKMRHQGKLTIAVTDAIPRTDLISSADFASSFDPHFWFSITHWKKTVAYVASELSKIDVKNALIYKKKC
jgi:manganese/zinc/iron transport system substrate-binding protein